MKKDGQDSAALTVDEAHEIIGRSKISRAGLYNGIRRGDIPSIRVTARRILIPRSAFMRWINGGQAA